MQLHDDLGPEPKPDARYVSMDNPSRKRFIVADVATSSDGGNRRWTFARPELRLLFSDSENQKLVVNLDIVEDTLKDTGPITISFFVNGSLVGKTRCPQPGSYHFEAPIGDEILKPGEVTLVAAEVDRHWIAPGDGARMGFLLVDAGIFPR